MKPINVDAEWTADARRAAEETEQEWLSNRPLVLMPGVEVRIGSW